MADAPRVFISYSNDSDEHADQVLALADALCVNGIDVILDRYVHPAPAEGWPSWMEQNLEAAKFVLMVCTENYRRRVMALGTGVHWEAELINNRICYGTARGARFIPTLLPGSEPEHIPGPVRGHSHYRLATFELTDPGFEALYRHLTDQPATPRPDLGSIKKLPPKRRPQPSPSPLPPAATGQLGVFDEQHLADVREACKEGLKKLADKPMRCEDDKRERTILQSLGRELEIVSKKSEQQLVESITSSVIEPQVDTIGSLFYVHKQLRDQNKLDEESHIAEIIDLVLPLQFPRDVISRALLQLQHYEAVLIENAVVTRTGAEIVMAGVSKKSPSFAEKPFTGGPIPQPVGKDLIQFESPAIGDPDQLEDFVRDLYRASGYSPDRLYSGGEERDREKRIARMLNDLNGRYQGRKSSRKRAPYCALAMPASSADRDHQMQTLERIRKLIPDLLFIELCPDSENCKFENFVITLLNTRFGFED